MLWTRRENLLNRSSFTTMPKLRSSLTFPPLECKKKQRAQRFSSSRATLPECHLMQDGDYCVPLGKLGDSCQHSRATPMAPTHLVQDAGLLRADLVREVGTVERLRAYCRVAHGQPPDRVVPDHLRGRSTSQCSTSENDRAHEQGAKRLRNVLNRRDTSSRVCSIGQAPIVDCQRT